MSDLISKLEWRYATKKIDPSQVVSQDKIDFYSGSYTFKCDFKWFTAL